MTGQQARSESLFYYFRMEDHIREDHLLRLVNRHIDFRFHARNVERELHTGRLSVESRSSVAHSSDWDTRTESPASAPWSKTLECTWLIAGLPALASINGFRITRPFPSSRSFLSFSSELSGSV